MNALISGTKKNISLLDRPFIKKREGGKDANPIQNPFYVFIPILKLFQYTI